MSLNIQDRHRGSRVFMSLNIQDRHRGSSSSPAAPQACQAGGHLSAGQGSGSSLHLHSKSLTNSRREFQGHQTAPSVTPRSLSGLWVTLPWPASAVSFHTQSAPALQGTQQPGHRGQELCQLSPLWGILRGLLVPAALKPPSFSSAAHCCLLLG